MIDIAKARELCERIKGYEDPDAGNWADFAAAKMLPVALDRIEELEAIGKAKDFGLSGLANRIADLEAVNQTLKDALVEAIARDLYPFNMPLWEHLPEEDHDKMMFSGKTERMDGKKSYRGYAREQLSREMPDIDWENRP
jgi:hypothetical protein